MTPAEENLDIVSFRDFITSVNARFVFYPYLTGLIDILQKVVEGKIDRLMIFMPPRHGKSELVSRLLPAYYLYRYPEKWVGINSYGAELSYSFSRIARENFRLFGGKLKDDAATIKNWETKFGGGLWAAGVGGPITGKGFHLGVIDDPVKNSEEAQSFSIQQRNNQWFDSVFSTREEPGAAIVLCQTRWNKRDLTGYILDKEDTEPERWVIVHNEAIKTIDSPNYPASCMVIDDPRNVGEALNPERYSFEKLQKFKKRLGVYFWSSLYQQTPGSREGRVYHEFTAAGPDSKSLDLSLASGFWHSHDFGAVNHVWGLWAKIEDCYYLIHSEKLPQGTTKSKASHVNKILARYDKIVAGYGGAASEKQQRLDFTREGLKIRVPTVRDVESQIDKVNKMLADNKMVICSDQVLVIDQLENCVRDDKENIVDKATFHFTDMIRYFAGGIARQGWAR